MERRRLPRVKKRLSCGITADGRTYSAVVLDVSPNGVFLQTSAKLSVGAIVDLELHLPNSKEPVRAQGRVARQKLVPHELRSIEKGGVGVHIDLPPSEFLEYYASATHADIPGGKKPEKAEAPKVDVAAAARARAEAARRLRGGGFFPDRRDPSRTAMPYRVRMAQINGSRTRTIDVLCDSAQEAEAEALEQTGDEWKVLAVEVVASRKKPR